MSGWAIGYYENQQRVMPLIPLLIRIVEGSDLKLVE